MVQVVAPQKHETVLDPACGTAGFLISAYKYILNNPSPQPSDLTPGPSPKRRGELTIQERQRLYENFTGYDISPDMVRLSLVNLYLHGFVKPQIHEYDTLTSEERWNEYADVILANPPFMSPKGGIQPHKRFSVQSSRSEVLFVDYMAEHLTPNGRAAIIVPEGIIFQSGSAYKQLRKFLVEQNYLWAVVSLPAGVFNPYAGVKTSILFLDKSLAKKTDQVLFVKVTADGFDLGAQRRPIDFNDLPSALNTLHAWHKAVLDGKPAAFLPTIASALLVSTSRLAENGDYNLGADRYRQVTRVGKQTHPMIALEKVFKLSSGKFLPEKDRKEGHYPVFGGNGITGYHNEYFIDKGTIVIGRVGAYCGVVHTTAPKSWVTDNALYATDYLLEINQTYLFHILTSLNLNQYAKQGGQPSISQSTIYKLDIPLPPLEIQRQIVDEIAAHQRVIHGARQVVEGWKPNLESDLAECLPEGMEDWEKVKLGDQLTFVGSGVTPLGGKETYVDDGVLFIRSQNVLWGACDFSDAAYITEDVHKEMSRSQVKRNDVLLNITGASIGRSAVYLEDREANVNQHVTILRCNGSLEPNFLMNYMISKEGQDQIRSVQSGASRQALNYQQIKAMKIPLPPLEVQREIVARIERERAIVEGNRELIRIYEEKVKKVIERVWEG